MTRIPHLLIAVTLAALPCLAAIRLAECADPDRAANATILRNLLGDCVETQAHCVKTGPRFHAVALGAPARRSTQDANACAFSRRHARHSTGR